MCVRVRVCVCVYFFFLTRWPCVLPRRLSVSFFFPYPPRRSHLFTSTAIFGGARAPNDGHGRIAAGKQIVIDCLDSPSSPCSYYQVELYRSRSHDGYFSVLVPAGLHLIHTGYLAGGSSVVLKFHWLENEF